MGAATGAAPRDNAVSRAGDIAQGDVVLQPTYGSLLVNQTVRGVAGEVGFTLGVDSGALPSEQ